MPRTRRLLLVPLALVALLLLPGVAFAAARGTAPLAQVPSEYEPALRVAAEQLGLSYDELKTASEAELQRVLCGALDDTSTDQLVADARAALDQASDAQLAALSARERRQLWANLPTIIREVEARYCSAGATPGQTTAGEGSASDGGTGADLGTATGDDTATADGRSAEAGAATTGQGSGASTVGDIPVPNRVDTGGGGAGDARALPVAFGALFATLFGLAGVAITGRRRTA